MHNQLSPDFLAKERKTSVARALREDLGLAAEAELDLKLDVTAQLVSADTYARATITLKEVAVVCGQEWVNEVFAQISPDLGVHWKVPEGTYTPSGTIVCELTGSARALLTGERTALNFLQTLSGTATSTRMFVTQLAGSKCTLLDTRKTIPGLRAAQKYAVGVGGGSNHRIGLFDAFLIKENHIAACGGIANAIAKARQIAPTLPVEVEVESFDELAEAIEAGADIIMLDEFADTDLAKAVAITAGRAKLEVSGSVTAERLKVIAESGVDFISSGSLTKHLRAIDYSLRVISS